MLKTILFIAATIAIAAAFGCAYVARQLWRSWLDVCKPVELTGTNVFLSYRSEYRTQALKLADALRREGSTVTFYDPTRKWTDPFRHIAPSIEAAHLLLVFAPARGCTPWMKFETEVAHRFNVPRFDWDHAATEDQIKSMLNAISRPTMRTQIDADARFDVVSKALLTNVSREDDRAPQENDLYSSAHAALLHHMRGDGTRSIPVMLLLALCACVLCTIAALLSLLALVATYLFA